MARREATRFLARGGARGTERTELSVKMLAMDAPFAASTPVTPLSAARDRSSVLVYERGRSDTTRLDTCGRERRGSSRRPRAV